MTLNQFAPVLALALLVAFNGASAQHAHGDPVVAKPFSAVPAPDSAAIVAAVSRFHSLLEAGDTLAVARMLAPDVIVLESGELETRAQYLSHHLHSDAAFAKAVRSERKLASVTQSGDVAWTVATSTTKGTYRDRPVNSRGAELMVLKRSGGEWLISAIHWSSRRVER